nr:hypothetical protein BSM_20860 [uncultured archaeon]
MFIIKHLCRPLLCQNPKFSYLHYTTFSAPFSIASSTKTKSFIILFLSPTEPSTNLYLLIFFFFSATSLGKHIFFSSLLPSE